MLPQCVNFSNGCGLSGCLSARISQKPHVQTSWNFLYMLPMAVARSSSDDNAIRYVFPVLWMTSCFHKMMEIQIHVQAWVCDVVNYWPWLARWHRGEVCYCRLPCSQLDQNDKAETRILLLISNENSTRCALGHFTDTKHSQILYYIINNVCTSNRL